MSKKLMYDDKGMMSNPGEWPCWPYLPIKRRSNDLARKDLGILMNTEEFEKGEKYVVVYHVYLYGLPKTPEEWEAAPKTEYSSIDDLLADGWMVD